MYLSLKCGKSLTLLFIYNLFLQPHHHCMDEALVYDEDIPT